MKYVSELLPAVNEAGGKIVEIEAEALALFGGWGYVATDTPGVVLKIVFSTYGRWDHVSVSGAKKTDLQPVRIPSYHEMVKIKRILFRPDEVVMELHVAEDDHINTNTHVLHLWRPQDREIPLPPKIMV